jgi:hypothetical protein
MHEPRHDWFRKAPWMRACRLGLFSLLAAAPAAADPAEELAEAIQGLSLALLGPAILASFVALEIVLWLLAPEPLTATGRVIARGRGRCLLVGVIAVVVAALLLGALGEKPQPAPSLAALLLGLLALGTLAGLTALAALLGRAAIEKATGRPGSQTLAVSVGAVLLAASSVFPVVGWVLFLYFLLVGLGGFLLAASGALRREKGGDER